MRHENDREKKEKNLLAKLASGVLVGTVGDEREYCGYRSVFCGKYGFIDATPWQKER